MELIADMLAWFAGDERWSLVSPRGVPYRVLEHLWVSVVSTALAITLALPPALYLAHRRKAEAVASAIVNLGRAIPSFGLIVLFWLLATRLEGLGTQFWPLVAALVALALPPIFTNAYTAIRQVDAAVVESARGMGYTERRILWSVELPLASPVVLAGIRLAMLQVVATTAIGAIVTNGGGLGRFIVDGFAQGVAGRPQVLAGAVLLAILTLIVELCLSRLERRLVPDQVRDATSLESVANRTGPAG